MLNSGVTACLLYREPAAEGDPERAPASAPSPQVDRDTRGQAPTQGPDSQAGGGAPDSQPGAQLTFSWIRIRNNCSGSRSDLFDQKVCVIVVLQDGPELHLYFLRESLKGSKCLLAVPLCTLTVC
jgi:hypothetical protein